MSRKKLYNIVDSLQWHDILIKKEKVVLNMLKNVKEAKEMIKTNQVSILIAEAGLGKLDIVVEALTESNDTPLEILNCSQIID